MKKFSFFAAMAAVAISASAQYQVDPGIQQVLDKGEKYTFDVILLDGITSENLVAAGHKVNHRGPNDVNSFLYVWDGTFNAGDSSFPGVDFQMEGYTSLVVGTVGWSGAGFFVSADAGYDMTGYTDETRLHIGFRANNAPESVGLVFMNEDNYNKTANIAIGQPFNDNGVIYPAVATFDAGGDWAGLDISFGDLRKICPAFDCKKSEAFQGNILAVLCGGVPGKDISLDAVYIYTPINESGVNAIASGENAPVEYFNLQGVRVATPENGIFITRQGSKVSKVVL